MPKQKPNEQVQQIPLSEIRPFKNHPFKVTDDELMQQTIDSIMQVGVLNPAIIRPAPEGGYEMVSGHRRLHAADLAELKTIPAIVRNLDDDEAVILMVDSNLQRETISPMERAQAYKMKLEALKHQGKRVDLEGNQLLAKLARSHGLLPKSVLMQTKVKDRYTDISVSPSFCRRCRKSGQQRDRVQPRRGAVISHP